MISSLKPQLYSRGIFPLISISLLRFPRCTFPCNSNKYLLMLGSILAYSSSKDQPRSQGFQGENPWERGWECMDFGTANPTPFPLLSPPPLPHPSTKGKLFCIHVKKKDKENFSHIFSFNSFIFAH